MDIAESFSHPALASAKTLESYLWHSKVPDPTLYATPPPYEVLQDYDRSVSMIPMDFLEFEPSLEQSDHLIGIESDGSLSYFTLHRDSGKQVRIGISQDQQQGRKVSELQGVFKIDGRNGEKVVRIEVGVAFVPVSIKVCHSSFPYSVTQVLTLDQN